MRLPLGTYARGEGDAISGLATWEFGPARGYDPSVPDGDSVCSMIDNAGVMPKCVCTQEPFHWHGDCPPRHPWSKIVIYETHVRGFTIHPTSGVKHSGTYRGRREKISFKNSFIVRQDRLTSSRYCADVDRELAVFTRAIDTALLDGLSVK